MNNLNPWLDESPPSEIADLLRAGKREQPKVASLQRALLAVGVASAASAATGSALGAGSKTVAHGGASLIAKWTTVGIVSAGAVAGTVTGVVYYTAKDKDNVTAPAPTSRIASVRSTKAMVAAPPATVSSTVESPADSAVLPPTRLSHAVRTPSKAPPVVVPQRHTQEELELIDKARSSLRAGDPNATLRWVHDYDRRFPQGLFAPESTYLRMEAALRLGNTEAAAHAAREIVTRYPNGAQVSRASEVLQHSGAMQNP
jgi:TolA-binding protein